MTTTLEENVAQKLAQFRGLFAWDMVRDTEKEHFRSMARELLEYIRNHTYQPQRRTRWTTNPDGTQLCTCGRTHSADIIGCFTCGARL